MSETTLNLSSSSLHSPLDVTVGTDSFNIGGRIDGEVQSVFMAFPGPGRLVGQAVPDPAPDSTPPLLPDDLPPSASDGERPSRVQPYAVG